MVKRKALIALSQSRKNGHPLCSVSGRSTNSKDSPPCVYILDVPGASKRIEH